MAQVPPSQVTELLHGWRAGDRKASDALLPLVYDELRRLAHHRSWESRAHFFAIAAQLMRQILVDYARRHRASKRGSGACMLTLDKAMALPQRQDVDVVALDDALNTLAEIDPRQSRVVELRFFAGLSLEETSEVMGIATATVQRDWTAARAWLHREISRNPSSRSTGS